MFGNSAPSGTLHFTQVVWEGSKELGIGMATGKKGGMTCTYVVARYRPAGNFAGQYRKNVPKGSFTGNVCKNLNSIIKGIEDGKRRLDLIYMDDKFGEEKVEKYDRNHGRQFHLEPPIDKSLHGDHNEGRGLGQGSVGKIKSAGGNSKTNGNEKNVENTVENVIHLDEKEDNPEVAEKLINKDKKKNRKETKKVDKQGKAEKQNGNTQIDGKKDLGSGIGQADDMEFSAGTPLSRNATKSSKKPATVAYKFRTHYDANPSQRQVDSTSVDFEQKGLSAHNAFRKIHGVAAMVLDAQLSKEAAQYAKVIAQKGSLIHSKSGGRYGENLAMGCTSKNEEMSAEEATKNW